MSLDISKMRQEMGRLSRERWGLEKELAGVLSRKFLLKGSLVQKYKACNKPGCRCTRGELHGPFCYLSVSQGGKTKMIFIKKHLWSQAKELSTNYRQWRKKRARIAQINREILFLIDQMEKERTLEVSSLEKR
ncbi:hypothetical protein HKBW3S42_00362 [Candidatus Hakubella thermalkaliphila]|uniref:DUF6788 domain-containing protein n=1 Tax=Candidatus Hakubella thermalkaliphila TaxID=2754717 RepID=A0A6V8PIK6_9ACTN|nr:hypothetical protein HKBW3S42_00362 [Candidatus Hakubella thermalkaliphila]